MNNLCFPTTDSLPSQNSVRKMDITEKNKINWKKSVSDRLMRRIVRQRTDRVDSIRLNKEEIVNEIMYEEMIDSQIDDQVE